MCVGSGPESCNCRQESILYSAAAASSGSLHDVSSLTTAGTNPYGASTVSPAAPLGSSSLNTATSNPYGTVVASSGSLQGASLLTSAETVPYGGAMSATVQRIVLVACGCFNPITNMHLRLFELARDALHKTGRYRVLAGLVSPASDHYQKVGLLPIAHRHAMVRLATQTSDWIRLDTWEGQQAAWTRTALVIRHMDEVVQSARQLAESEGATASKRVKKDPDSLEEWLLHVIRTDAALAAAADEENNETKASLGAIGVKMVCGSDLLQSFAVPNLWLDADIETLVRDHGIVCINRPGSDARRFVYETDLLSKYEDNIHIVTEWMVSDVSATKVRRAIRRGESVKYLLSDEVIAYIRKHSLYAGPSAATTPCPEKKRKIDVVS